MKPQFNSCTIVFSSNQEVELLILCFYFDFLDIVLFVEKKLVET
jgi:hypothetical protein